MQKLLSILEGVIRVFPVMRLADALQFYQSGKTYCGGQTNAARPIRERQIRVVEFGNCADKRQAQAKSLALTGRFTLKQWLQYAFAIFEWNAWALIADG